MHSEETRRTIGKIRTLRFRKARSDFRDACTQFRNQIINESNAEILQLLFRTSELHRTQAKKQYKIIRIFASVSKREKKILEIHLAFDFAEKVFLPFLRRQSGKSHFITGSNFDIFGVATSNSDKVFLYGLF